MNEMQAALGLIQLKYIEDAVKKRKKITEHYRSLLGNFGGLILMKEIDGASHNYAYFPIRIVEKIFGTTRDDVYKKLISENIYCRRYFYPLISQLPMYRDLKSSRNANLSVAERITGEILCLPIYPDLPESTIEFICNQLKNLRK